MQPEVVGFMFAVILAVVMIIRLAISWYKDDNDD